MHSSIRVPQRRRRRRRRRRRQQQNHPQGQQQNQPQGQPHQWNRDVTRGSDTVAATTAMTTTTTTTTTTTAATASSSRSSSSGGTANSAATTSRTRRRNRYCRWIRWILLVLVGAVGCRNLGLSTIVVRQQEQQQQQQQPRRRRPTERGDRSSSTTNTATVATAPFFLTLSGHYRGRRNDVYAASWWQSTDRFVGMMEWIASNETLYERLIKLESACHLAVEYKYDRDDGDDIDDDADDDDREDSDDGDDRDDVRLTVDWMMLGVEHLSKWWKTLRYQKHTTAFETLMQRLQEYVVVSSSTPSSTPSSSSSSAWTDTVAVVAYDPLYGARDDMRARQLDSLVTAATISSLIRKRVGRIVVVMERDRIDYVRTQIWPYVVGWLDRGGGGGGGGGGNNGTTSNNNSNKKFTPWQETWDLMWQQQQGQFHHHHHHHHHHPHRTTDETIIRMPDTTAGGSSTSGTGGTGTSIILWPVDTRVRDKRGNVRSRVPRRALLSLYDAMREQPSQQSQSHQSPQNTVSQPWMLGGTTTSSRRRWRYVYYTEQDSLLHASTTRYDDSRQRATLDRNRILVPHRWQPMPHASDFFRRDDRNDDDHRNDHRDHVTHRPRDLPDAFFVPDVKPWDTVYELYDQDFDDGVDDPSRPDPKKWNHCCDTGITMPYTSQSPCNNDYWYLCGLGMHGVDDAMTKAGGNSTFERRRRGGGRSLDHLRNFTLIRLVQGSRLTLLAASEHARLCRPSRVPCTTTAK